MEKKTREQIQKEALDAIDDKKRAGLNISVGVGKTKVGIMDMARQFHINSKYLVVAPKLSILKSWKDELIKHGYDYLLKHIKFSTYLSLNKQDDDYDTIYLDECHNLKKKHHEYLRQYILNSGRTIGLSGTYPSYSSSETGIMCSKYCPKVYQYLIDDAIEDRILNDYEIIVHKLSLSQKKNLNKTGSNGNWVTSEYKDYEYWDNRSKDSPTMLNKIGRMRALMNYKTKEKYAKGLIKELSEKTLIFANTKEQADLLCSKSHHTGNKESKQNLEDFINDKFSKLSAVEQLSEGVNIKGLKTIVIMHAYGNNKQATQKIGRALRLNPKDKATIHILCYENTADEVWVKDALKGFNQSKITWKKGKAYAELYV